MHFAIIREMANVQIRDVPDDLHRRLKAQAAMSGQSLNEFLLARVGEIARTPSVSELAGRIRARGLHDGPSSADLVREERDRR
jgi:antitoxin FitA